MPIHASIFDYLAEHVALRPNAIAYIYGTREISFRSLNDDAAKFRRALSSIGIEPGDRVALVMHDCPEMIVALLGIMGMGAIAVPCNTMLDPTELTYIFEDSGARCIIITPDQVSNLYNCQVRGFDLPKVIVAGPEVPELFYSFEALITSAQPLATAELDGAAPAFIIYTSGSTGVPKGAVHCHRDIPYTIETSARNIYDISPEHRLFSAPRLFFGYGFTNSFSFPVGLGATCILSPERPTAAAIAQIFKKYRPTIFFGVPANFRALVEFASEGNRFDSSSLEFAISAGEKLSAQLYHQWKKVTGTDVLDFCGTTELLYAFIANRKHAIRPGSSGLAVPEYEVKLVNEQGQILHGAGTGALHVRGPSAISHYWRKPEKTAETIRDGWVKTGDIYRRDKDGFYFFEGRVDDVFKSSGLWVSPAEIEEVICAQEAALEAAIISEPGPDGDYVITAFVVLRRDETASEQVAAEILAKVAKLLPRYKRPSRVHFLSRLPRTTTGKLQRFKLRALSKYPDLDMPMAV